MTKPAETLKAEAANKNGMAEGAMGYALAAIVAALFVGISVLFSAISSGPLAGLGLLLVPVAFVGVIVFSFIGAGMTHICAKLLGGKGSFTKYYYLSSIIHVPIMIIGYAVGLVPCLGSLVSLALGIYSIYLIVIALRELHGFSTMRAIVAYILPILVLAAIIAVLFVAIMGVALIGFFPSMSSDAKLSESSAYWMSSRPFQITQSAQIIGAGTLSLVVRNVDSDPLTITGVSVSSSGRSGTYSTPTTIGSGENAMINVPLMGSACTAGENYEYTVIFNYDDATRGITDRKQYGAKGVVGKCA